MKLKTFWNLGLCIVLSGCVIASAYLLDIQGKTNKENNKVEKGDVTESKESVEDGAEKIVEALAQKYDNVEPTEWGESIEGVVTNIPTEEKVIFLTFDACGGAQGSLYDAELIDFLINNNIKANLFINSRWIDKNMDKFKDLAANDLFEIENHGYIHRPLSINGNSIYDIEGTRNSKEIYEEIEMNALKIEDITGRKPKFFRAGTAYYDDVAIKIANELGHKIAGFDVIGDGGATYTKDQIISECLNATNGSIVILHMNQPNADVYEGIKEAIPMLQEQGYTFEKLEDYM